MASLFLFASIMVACVLNCQADLINNVCSKSGNPPACNQILRSDPRSKAADLLGLAKIAADLSQSSTINTKNIARNYDHGATKAQAETCVQTCVDAIGQISKCVGILKSFDKGRLSDLQTYASAADTNVDTCDDTFGASEPAPLKAASQKAQNTIGAFLAVLASF